VIKKKLIERARAHRIDTLPTNWVILSPYQALV
jgi:hypothetical protein